MVRIEWRAATRATFAASAARARRPVERKSGGTLPGEGGTLPGELAPGIVLGVGAR
jgi:hypothetical protein